VSPRPTIFISAVSRELKSARQLVANTLTFLGYEPVWQDIFGTEQGDLRGMLRRQIDECKGVVQLVGYRYGAEPPTIDEQFGRVSYTQYEALYAKQRGKKVWYLVLDENFPTDAQEPESGELRELQAAYRQRLKTESSLRYSLGSSEALETSVLKLRNDLSRLRRGVKQWAAAVIVLLVILVGAVVWIMSELKAMKKEIMAKLPQSMVQLPSAEAKAREAHPDEKPEQIEERAYAEVAKTNGIDARTLREKLPQFAKELKNAPNATTYERANAAYVTKEYVEAERLALVAADEAQRATPPKMADAIKALDLAGQSADARLEYSEALQHFRAAERLTDHGRNPLEWAGQQWYIADVLNEQGQYAEAEKVYRGTLQEYRRARGEEAEDVLTLRTNLDSALLDQGKYAEAETEDRAVIKLAEKVLGPEHLDTIRSRNNLAFVFDYQGKYAEAETEFREVIKLTEKVLGPEHPRTLGSRNGLASALVDQGKYAEAETELRAVIKLAEKVLGPEHPETLWSRNNLANALADQGKYAEAETEFRAVIKLAEKVLGPENPHTLQTCYDLGLCLKAENKMDEAKEFARRAAEGASKVLGANHPDTLKYEKLWQELQRKK
jgi:hypothetical protein